MRRFYCHRGVSPRPGRTMGGPARCFESIFTRWIKERIMIEVGGLINASRKAIGKAIFNQDAAAIQKVAKDQETAGANYIDVNADIFVDEEVDYLKWLVTAVQKVVDFPRCIDSPSDKVIVGALTIHKGDVPPMIIPSHSRKKGTTLCCQSFRVPISK